MIPITILAIENDDDRTFMIQLYIDYRWFILNTMLIHGRPAMIVEKDIWTTIIWNVGNHCLIVEFTGEKEEAIKIAESVVMIRE